jgi:hypothetical protein
VVLALSLIVSACEGYEPPPLPTTPTNPAASTVPTRIVLTANSRSDQQLDVFATVLSADGHRVPGIAVAFKIGAGSITPSATTDVSGTALVLATSTAFTTISATIGGDIVSSVEVLQSSR